MSIKTDLLGGSSRVLMPTTLKIEGTTGKDKLRDGEYLPDGEKITFVQNDHHSQPGKIHFVGMEERVDLREENKFQVMAREEMERLVGHKIGTGPDGKPNNLSDRDLTVLGAYAGAMEVLYSNANLSPHERREVIRKLRKEMNVKRGDVDVDAAGVRHITAEIERQSSLFDRNNQALDEICAWLDATEFKLQRPDGSQLAASTAALEAGDVLTPLTTRPKLPPDVIGHYGVAHSFVVEHDWRAALAGATMSGEGSGEVALPYDRACFEFVVNGKRLLALLFRFDDAIGTCFLLLKTKAGWAFGPPYDLSHDCRVTLCAAVKDKEKEKEKEKEKDSRRADAFQKVADLVADNVRAICIALEAKVAETEVVRIPAKLNAARAKRGALPLLDYHVVALATRHRTAPLPAEFQDADGEKRNSPRLHFRRAHWRQYTNHRTRISWQLVGDPQLGFIDKHYRV